MSNTPDAASILAHSDLDTALTPPPIITIPDDRYAARHRQFQGIPGIERTRGGRLWAVWYTGGEGEGADNHVVLAQSDDDAATWPEPVLVIDPTGQVRAFDPCIWLDPHGRLWLFWAQSFTLFDGRIGTWAIRCDEPDSDRPTWSPPRRLCDGIMMNKPTVLRDGTWLLPAAIWRGRKEQRDDMAAQRYSNVFASTDAGATWTRRGGADVPERGCDEHMIVELRDGRLWMLVRTSYGIGQSFSADGGCTWSPGEDSGLPGAGSRFFIRRLRSGWLLLVTHTDFADRDVRRCNLTALLSDDDGATWPHRLLLDERDHVSYPDGVEAEDGRLFIIYDRQRYADKEILLATVTEHDIIAGRCTNEAAQLKRVVSRAGD